MVVLTFQKKKKSQVGKVVFECSMAFSRAPTRRPNCDKGNISKNERYI